MKTHYDLTGEPYSGFVTSPSSENFVVTLNMAPEIEEVSNATVTFRLGFLTPSAARELWNCLGETPEEDEFRIILTQYFFNIYGADIVDPLTPK